MKPSMAQNRISYGRVRAGEYPNIPALRVGVRQFLTWTFAGLGVMLVYQAVVFIIIKRPIWAAASAVPHPLAMSVGAFRWVRWNRRVGRDVIEYDRKVCLHCLYPLRDLAPRGNCPECGKAYEIENVVKEWTAFKAN